MNNLLVHESQDTGVIRLVDVITTHKEGDTLFTLEVGAVPEGDPDYIRLAKTLLDHAVNLLCVNRGKETFTDFTGLPVREGDVLVYVAKQRMNWSAVRALANP